MKNIFSKFKFTKKVIIIIIVALAVVLIGLQFIIKKDDQKYNIVKVEKGSVLQEVSETGTVKTGEEVNLAFKTSGRVEKVYVQIGDTVKANQNLVKLESNQLYIQLQEAQANLSIAQAKLDKLNAGATADEISVTETEVTTAQVALDTANKNLNDAYQSALITLDDAYLKSYNSLETIKVLQRTYFNTYDQQGAKVADNKNYMENSLATTKTYLDSAKNTKLQTAIDSAITDMQGNLNIFSQSLAIIRQACEESIYWHIVSSADKTSVDTHRTNINTALTNVLSAQQTISTKKAAVNSASSQLSTVQGQLILQKAPPRTEDVSLYNAQVKQAEAQVNLIYQQINDNILKAPTDGQVTDINKKAGEMVQATESEISFISSSGLQIKTDVYEEDVVKIKVGNSVEISFIAFPDKTFSGKVITINPAQKIVNGVVYYEIATVFDQAPAEEIKPGMTADVKIKTAQKDNVLFLPQDAVNKEDGKAFVDILKEDKKSETKEVAVGLEGSDDRIEIVSGLQEGQQVIIK